MQVIATTLYGGRFARDPGYRSVTLDAGNGREWHCYSDPDGSNVRQIGTRAARTTTGFRAIGDKRAAEVSEVIKAHLSGRDIANARTLDGIEEIALAKLRAQGDRDAALKIIIGAAESHLEDLETGVSDSLYDAEENREAIKTLRAALAQFDPA